MQKINFALNTIPQYDGNINSLNIYIGSVDLVSRIIVDTTARAG